MTGGWITSDDRARWQQQAVGELGVILEGCRTLLLLAWTVGASGSLAGRVTGASASGRDAFTAWQQALAMDDVLEAPLASGTWLRARSWRGGVRVTVTATVSASRGRDSGESRS